MPVKNGVIVTYVKYSSDSGVASGGSCSPPTAQNMGNDFLQLKVPMKSKF